MHRASVFFLVGIVFFGLGPLLVQAQPASESSVQFQVSEPPSGALSQEELEGIAETIRRLEEHPLAEGADKARAILVQWLQASPDVEVSMCPGIAAPLVASESSALRRTMMQHLLSTAAYTIENPEADLAAAKLSGLKGALRVYEVSARQKMGPRKEERAQTERQQDDTGGAGAIQQLLQMREEGTLEKYVEQGVQSCRDSG
jgi:hypothetical protein